MIRARMRVGAAWRDAFILNLSSRGMMIKADAPPRSGTTLEVRRGRHVIIARVMWSRDRLCGLRTQDRLPTEAIIAEPDQSSGRLIVPGSERRAEPEQRVPRATAHDESRWRSRALEYLGLALVGASCAGLAYGAVTKALSTPLATVEGALAARRD